MRDHLSQQLRVGGAAESANVVVKIDTCSAGAILPAADNTLQASSAVKLRNGAIQRSMAWVICHKAVWAERRASESAPVVYRRSFRMSR